MPRSLQTGPDDDVAEAARSCPMSRNDDPHATRHMKLRGLTSSRPRMRSATTDSASATHRASQARDQGPGHLSASVQRDAITADLMKDRSSSRSTDKHHAKDL